MLEAERVHLKPLPLQGMQYFTQGVRTVCDDSTILDRLMHRCTMREFEGKSYRLKEAAARLVIYADGS